MQGAQETQLCHESPFHLDHRADRRSLEWPGGSGPSGEPPLPTARPSTVEDSQSPSTNELIPEVPVPKEPRPGVDLVTEEPAIDSIPGFQRLDVNRDHRITIDEIRDAFRRADVNGDGFLSVVEFSRDFSLQAMGPGKNLGRINSAGQPATELGPGVSPGSATGNASEIPRSTIPSSDDERSGTGDRGSESRNSVDGDLEIEGAIPTGTTNGPGQSGAANPGAAHRAEPPGAIHRPIRMLRRSKAPNPAATGPAEPPPSETSARNGTGARQNGARSSPGPGSGATTKARGNSTTRASGSSGRSASRQQPRTSR